MSDDAAPARRLPCSPGSVTDSTPGSGVAALVRASTAATPRRNAPSSPSSPGSSAITRLPQLPPAAWSKHAAVSSTLKTRCFLSFKAAQSAMDIAGLHEPRGTWIPAPWTILAAANCLGHSAKQYASLESHGAGARQHATQEWPAPRRTLSAMAPPTRGPASSSTISARWLPL